MTTIARPLALAALGLLLMLSPGRAHEAEAGPNGGPMVESKGLHLELVSKGPEVVVYLSDAAHAPLPSKGATARAVIQDKSGQRTVALAAEEPNRLVAKLESPLPQGTRIVVSARLADGRDLLGRFQIK